jgi:hypothetical protein
MNMKQASRNNTGRRSALFVHSSNTFEALDREYVHIPDAVEEDIYLIYKKRS